MNTSAPAAPRPRAELSGVPARRRGALPVLLAALMIVVLSVSSADLGLSVSAFLEGIPNLVGFVARMFPPDLSVVPALWQPILVTVEVALWGTVLAVCLSLVLALGAARNLLGRNTAIYVVSRAVLSVLRSLPDIIWALIFVAAVGLGPFPGVLALTVYSCGELGKLYAEAIENIDPGPREALESTGAGLFATIRWAILPQVLPEMITYSLYRLESNVRHAFVLGMVGAGGLGFELQVAMKLFQYEKVGAIILVIIATVAFIDFVSSRIRARVI